MWQECYSFFVSYDIRDDNESRVFGDATPADAPLLPLFWLIFKEDIPEEMSSCYVLLFLFFPHLIIIIITISSEQRTLPEND